MPSNSKSSAIPILHIDDNPNDRFLVRTAIYSARIPFAFHEAPDLEAAGAYFAFLPQLNRPFLHCRPALVLLDCDLGIQSGTDFLYWLRTQHRNSAIPVVMYSGSAGPNLIRECYALGANYFLRKAQTFDRTTAVIRSLHTCFSLPIPHFQYLARLPESEPDPSITEPAIA